MRLSPVKKYDKYTGMLYIINYNIIYYAKPIHIFNVKIRRRYSGETNPLFRRYRKRLRR